MSRQPRSGGTSTRRKASLSPRARVQATLRICAPFLMVVLRYARLSNERRADPAQVDSDLQRRLTELRPELTRAAGCSPQDVDDIEFALVAFTDEHLQLAPGVLQEYWAAHQWGYRRYGHTRAGEEFFERSERLYVVERAHVLAVFRLCLVLGFSGQYLSDGDDGAARDDLIEQMGDTLQELSGVDETGLSPRAERPYEKEFDERYSAWRAGLAIASAAFSVLIALVLWAVIDMEGSDLLREINQSDTAHAVE